MIYETAEKIDPGSEKMPFETYDGLERLDAYRRDRILLPGYS